MLTTKNRRLFLIFIISIFTGCAVHYPLSKNIFKYNEEVSIDLIKAQGHDARSTWGGGFFHPPKGHTFVSVTMSLNNISSKEQIVDLTKIVLLNIATRTKYPVAKIYQSAPVPISARENLKLLAGEKIKRVLMFTFPEETTPDAIEVNGQAYPIAYTEKKDDE